VRLVLAAAALAFALTSAAPVRAIDTREELIGKQIEEQMALRGELVPRPSDYYRMLDPLAKRIAKIADPLYDYPFAFVVIHRDLPNVFSIPGGDIYVTDSTFRFVQNKEEMTALLCHEVAHLVRHDQMRQLAREQNTGSAIAAAGAITGLNRYFAGRTGENAIYNAEAAKFWAQAEADADILGADICAEAGYNPWGGIWLFTNFTSADAPSLGPLADRPAEIKRIVSLRNHFDANAPLFGEFPSDIATGTPLR